MRNSWQHGMYSYYPPPPVVQEGEEFAAADEEINNVVGNQNDSHAQQQAPNEDESGEDECNSSDDKEMRNHSESLLSYPKGNQPHNHHWPVSKSNNVTLNNIIVGNFSCATLESIPLLPDMMQLVHLLQEVQHSRRS